MYELVNQLCISDLSGNVILSAFKQVIKAIIHGIGKIYNNFSGWDKHPSFSFPAKSDEIVMFAIVTLLSFYNVFIRKGQRFLMNTSIRSTGEHERSMKT